MTDIIDYMLKNCDKEYLEMNCNGIHNNNTLIRNKDKWSLADLLTLVSTTGCDGVGLC